MAEVRITAPRALTSGKVYAATLFLVNSKGQAVQFRLYSSDPAALMPRLVSESDVDADLDVPGGAA